MKMESLSNQIDILFCIPGKMFSGKFLDCWSAVQLYCIEKGISFGLSRAESPSLFHVRNMCLGGNFMRGKRQKPFNEQIDYKNLMWIDSDIIFNPSDVQRLLDANKDIITGLYMMEGRTGYSCVEKMEPNYYKVHGRYKFTTSDDIKNKKEPFEIDYAGMGFMLVKYGIFEKMEYPWFKPWFNYTLGKDYPDMSFEDVAFCIKARRLGFKIYAHPEVIVGHEKRLII